jgi:hypothetical protein
MARILIVALMATMIAAILLVLWVALYDADDLSSPTFKSRTGATEISLPFAPAARSTGWCAPARLNSLFC